MLNHSKYLAEMFVVSKIIPISYFHLGIRFPGFAKGFFVPFALWNYGENLTGRHVMSYYCNTRFSFF